MFEDVHVLWRTSKMAEEHWAKVCPAGVALSWGQRQECLKFRTSSPAFSNPESHISAAACRGYFIMRQRMLRGGEAIGGSIFCPSASSAGVGYLCGITHEQARRDKECSIRQPDVPLLDDLPSCQLPFFSPKNLSCVGLGWAVLTTDKGSEHPEISALSHIALLQGPLQGVEKVPKMLIHPPPHPYPPPAPQGRQVASHVVVVQSTTVQCLVQQCTKCTMHHSNQWFGQRLCS